MPIRGWKLDAKERADLLERFPPAWPNVVADHITLKCPKGEHISVPSADRGSVVGHVNDGAGLEALVVEINGTTVRPDGSTYHITWSIDRAAGRKPKDSNSVLARLGWASLDNSIPLRLIPASWT